jgi:hypothetical protein
MLFCKEKERSTGHEEGAMPNTAIAMRRSSGGSPPYMRHQPIEFHLSLIKLWTRIYFPGMRKALVPSAKLLLMDM